MSASTDRDKQRQRAAAAAYDSTTSLTADRRRQPQLLYNRYNNQFDFAVFSPSSVPSLHQQGQTGVGADLAAASSLLQPIKIRVSGPTRSAEELSQDRSGSSAPDMSHSTDHSSRQPGPQCSPATDVQDHSGNNEPRIRSTGSNRGCRHTDWEQCEERRVQELEEAKNRATQMEKTMKWWAECTANWRQKWSNIRDERNKYREEAKQLKAKCETLQSTLNKLKDDFSRTTQEKLDLQASLEKLIDQKSSPLSVSEYAPRTLEDNRIVRDICTQCYISDKPLQNFGVKTCLVKEIGCNTDNANGSINVTGVVPPPTLPKPVSNLKTVLQKCNGFDQLGDIPSLRSKLEETIRSLQAEQCESVFMKEKHRHLETEIDMLRAKCEELEASKTAILEELDDYKEAGDNQDYGTSMTGIVGDDIDHDQSTNLFTEEACKMAENAETLDDISFSVSCDDYVAVNTKECSLMGSSYVSCSSVSGQQFFQDEEIETVYDEIDAEIEKEVSSLREKMNHLT